MVPFVWGDWAQACVTDAGGGGGMMVQDFHFYCLKLSVVKFASVLYLDVECVRVWHLVGSHPSVFMLPQVYPTRSLCSQEAAFGGGLSR